MTGNTTDSASDVPFAIAVYNHKGGVGKTTVSLNLAVCLAANGNRVLLVDIDPQQSSTSILSRSGASPSLVDVLRKSVVIDDAVHETFVENLWIVPSTRSLTLLESGLDERLRPNQGLKTILTFSDYAFDFIVIDCPPAMGLLSVNALVASDTVVVPTTSGAFSLQGVQRTVETVNALRNGIAPSLTISGILVALFEGTQRDLQVVRELGGQFPGMLFRQRIRFDPAVLKAEVKRQPSCIYNTGAPASQDYIQFAAELLGRIHRQRRIDPQEFSFDDTARRIGENLAKPGFSSLEAPPVRPGQDDEEADAEEDTAPGQVRGGARVLWGAALFLAGFLCGGSLALWLGPAALAPVFSWAGL